MIRKKNHWNFACLISVIFALFVILLDTSAAVGCGLCKISINDTANISVNFPILQINKSITPEKFEQGDLVKFKIEILNLGNASAYTLSIVDDISQNFEYVKSIYDNSSRYLIYRYVFNVTGDGNFSCQNRTGQWTTNYTACVPNDNIEFHVINNKLTWGRFGFSSENKELPAKTAFVIKFYARAKENSSIGNFKNNASIKANYNVHQYICGGQATCQGGTCSHSDGVWYCNNCISPPTPAGICESTEIKLAHYTGLGLTITPNLNSSANFTIINKTEISLTKEINSTTNKFAVNEIVRFVLSINTNLNLTNGTLTEIKIIDELPYGVRFLNATPCNETELNLTTVPKLNKTDVYGADILDFFLPNLTNNITICINARVTENATNPLINRARIQAKNVRYYETKILNDTDDALFFVLKKADVKISKKTLTTNVVPNSNGTYEIAVWNEGDSEAINISISDPLPCNFVYINNSCNIRENTGGGNLTCPDRDTGNATFNISKLKGNSRIVFTFNVSVPSNASGMCGNTIVAEAKDTIGNKIAVDYITKTSYIYIETIKNAKISKYTNKKILNVGDEVEFNITVRNLGNVQLNVELSDELPYGFVNMTQTKWTFNISPAHSNTSTVRAKVNSSAFPGLNINCAKAVIKKGNTTIKQIQSCTSVYVSSPFLRVKKWTTTPTLNPGDKAQFFVMVENIGTGDANLTVNDSFAFSNASPVVKIDCPENVNIGNYPNLIVSGVLKSKEKCVLTYNITIPLNASGLYQNVVFAHSSLSNHSDKAYINVISNPNYNLWKMANVSTIDVDESVNFTIFIENFGNVPLNLSIVDIIPQGFKNLTSARFIDYINREEIKRYNVIARINKSINYSLAVNCVEVNATTPQNKILHKIACAEITIKRPLIQIKKWTTTPSRLPGEIANFYVMIKNDGDGRATNIKVTVVSNLTNPSAVVFHSGDCTGLTNGTYPNLITNGTLRPNQYCIFAYNMSVPHVAGYTNIATLNATDANGNQLNIQKAGTYVSAGGITPTISVEKYIANGTRYVDIGDRVIFTVKVKNLGNINIDIKNITDTPPHGFNCNYSNWTKIILMPNEISFINISCFVNRSALEGININEVKVDVSSAGNVSVSQSDNEFVIVEKPRLRITKDADSLNKNPGGIVIYILNLSNTGNAPAYNVSIRDTLPIEWRLVNGSVRINCSDRNNVMVIRSEISGGIQSIHFRRTILDPGVSCRITYNVSIPSNTKMGVYENSVIVTGRDKTGNMMEDKNKKAIYVRVDARMFVTVSADPIQVRRGEMVNFTIRIENLGDVPINNVSVINILPLGFVNLTPLEFSLGSIGRGEFKTINVTARVEEGTFVGTRVNKVYVNGTSPGEIILKAEAYATVYVTETPLYLVGDVDEKTLFIGSRANFRFIIVNPSLFGARDIDLTVDLVPGLKYDKNSTMLNGIPFSDENVVINEKENRQSIIFKNMSIYSKSINIITFTVLVEDYTYGIINASITYKKQGEIGNASTMIKLDENFVSKPYVYLFSNKELVSLNEPIKFKLVYDDSFNKFQNASIRIHTKGLKILNESEINMDRMDKGYLEFYALPDPTISNNLIINGEIYKNATNLSLKFEAVIELLIPPEGIITNVSFKTSNVSLHLRNERDNYTLELKKGWNLIGLPLILNSTDLREILKPIEGSYTDVFTYDNGWIYKSKYMNKWFGDLETIEPCKGYWIKLNNDVNLTLQGYKVKHLSINLHRGWNLISLPTLENITISDGKIFDYTDIFGYESGENRWVYKSTYMNMWLGNLENIEPGKGYWIKTNKFSNIQL